MKDILTEKIQLFYVKNRLNIMLIIGIIGVFLLSAEDLFPTNKPVTADKYSVDEYKQRLEQQLEEILSAVKGAGEVQVMITLEGSRENIYAWQEKTSTDEKSGYETGNNTVNKRETYENEIVMVNAGSDKTALIEKTMEPVVQGVVVVCSGADDIKVTSDITNAVSVALNVTSNRICVIKMD